MRQIYEFVSLDLAEEYTKTDYPKQCLPCSLVDKPGSSAKWLVVRYGKLTKRTKKHWRTPPGLEKALERASVCLYRTKPDRRSRFWQVKLTNRA